MSKTKEETVQQWRESLAESARLAVEALSAITPINMLPASTDEASKILGQASLRIRELVRPEPKTVAFLEEAAWYRMKEAAKPAGEYHTPKSALDFVLANPPMGDIQPADEPIDPKAPKLVQGEARHMSIPEASGILMELARKRSMSIDQVNALEMAVRRLMCRHFQRQRNWAKRRAARLAEDGSPHPEPAPSTKHEAPSTEEEAVQ